jgi:glycosyltransferase involved in cell wall biosynthesis
MSGFKRIGIDCRMIKESGIGRYIENVVSNLSELDSNNSYFLFVQNLSDFPLNLGHNFNLVEAKFSWHGLDEQTKFLKLINKYNLNLYFSPHPNMPYLYSKDYILTIHDLTMFKEKTGRASTYSYPVYLLKWLVFRISLWFTVIRAKKIITVSNFVKDQIVSEFKIKPNKVEVIYNGVTDTINRVTASDINKKVKDRLGITKPFLFYVGNAYPHKNLENLILAFELLNQDNSLQLVLGGKEDYFYSRLKQKYGELDNVIYPGYLTDLEISSLYSSCEAFVYPSISEGFGIQIIEALKVGAKVVCSNNSCFPEIAGKYAYYFNPFSIEDIKKTIKIALKQVNKSDFHEIKKYLEKFSWKNSALKHYDIFKKD